MRFFSQDFWSRVSRLLKLGWYLGATVLILSLPIFSDFPVRRGPLPVRETPLTDPPLQVKARPPSPEPALWQRPPPARFSAGASRAPLRAALPSRSVLGKRLARRAIRSAASRASHPLRVAALDAGRPGVAGGLLAGRHPFVQERRRAAGEEYRAATATTGVDEVELGYRQAQQALFAGSTITAASQPDNPFEGALDSGASANPGTGDGASSNPPPSDSGDGSSGGTQNPPVEPPDMPDPGQGSSDPPPPDPGSPPPDSPEPTPPPDGDSQEPPPDVGSGTSLYEFVVVGRFDDSGEDGIVRRARSGDNGELVFENGYRLGFFPGSLHSLVGLSDGDLLLTSDMDRDGLTDFVSFRAVSGVGSQVDSFLSLPEGQFTLTGTGLLYLQAVRSMALFDFTGDGVQELVLVLRDQNELQVLELENGQWTPLKQLLLPVAPGLLMNARGAGGLGERLLLIFDTSLNSVLQISQRQPNLIRLGSPVAITTRTFQVDFQHRGIEGDQVLAISNSQVLELVESRGGELEAIAHLEVAGQVPLVIVGDFFGTGGRQTIWIP